MTHLHRALCFCFCVGFAAACASAPESSASSSSSKLSPSPTVTATVDTRYYAGTMTVTSPDGATPYGPPKPALVSRAVTPGNDTIVETVVDDGALRATTLRRQEGAVFSASDEAASFSGTVTMTEKDGAIVGWSYDLSMSDGSGTITGTATIGDTGIQTEKYFSGPDGQKKVRIVDDLKPITKTEYDEKLTTLLKK